MKYVVILVGDICTVLPVSAVIKYDTIVFEGSREQCCHYSDSHNRSYVKELLAKNGFHRSDNSPQPLSI